MGSSVRGRVGDRLRRLASFALSRNQEAAITVGGCGTVALFASGRSSQGLLGLVMLLTYLFTVRWPTAGMTLAIPLLTLTPTIAGVALTVPVLAGIAAGSTTDLLSGRRRSPRGVTVSGIVLVSWLAVVLIFSDTHIKIEGSRAATTAIVVLQVLLLVLAARGVSPKALMVSASLTASYAGWVAFFSPGEKNYAWRHGGLGLNPNSIGLILAVGIVVVVGLAVQRHYRLAVACAPGLVLGLAVSQSRSAVVAAAAGVFVVLVAHFGLPRTLRARLIAVALVMVTFGGLTLFWLLRVGTWAQQSDAQRLDLAELALRLTSSHPILGVGWLNFPHFAAASTPLGIAQNTHNGYLRLAAEGGVLALVLWLVFLFSAMRRPTAPMRAALAGSVLAWAVGILFINGLSSPALSLAPMLLLGALAGAASGPSATIPSMIMRKPSIVPRKVVLCVGNLNLGGTERQVVLLAKGLVEQGVDVHVVTFRGGPRRADLLAAGARSSILNTFPEGYRWRGIPMLVASWRFLRVLRRERPDVVHGFLLHAYLFSSLIAKFASVPVIVTGRRSLGELDGRSQLLRAAASLSNGLTDAVVANAKSVADRSIQSENLDLGKVATIYNAVEAMDSGEAVPRREGVILRVVNVANLRVVKGQQHIVSAAAILAAQGIRVRIQIVGEGVERDELAARAAHLGVDLVLGGRSRDVQGILQGADVYVHSSVAEGMSNAIMEAMAVGLPIVATDVGGTAELLGGCGLLVPPGDPNEIAVALAHLARDRESAAELGSSARERVLRDFSEAVLVTRHLNLYGGLMERECVE